MLLSPCKMCGRNGSRGKSKMWESIRADPANLEFGVCDLKQTGAFLCEKSYRSGQGVMAK